MRVIFGESERKGGFAQERVGGGGGGRGGWARSFSPLFFLEIDHVCVFYHALST